MQKGELITQHTGCIVYVIYYHCKLCGLFCPEGDYLQISTHLLPPAVLCKLTHNKLMEENRPQWYLINESEDTAATPRDGSTAEPVANS